jgi:hypothetical protein
MNTLRRLIAVLASVAAASVAGWAVAGLYGWAAVMALGAGLVIYLGIRPNAFAGLTGSGSGEMVGLTIVPNSALAEVAVSKLHARGIGASYRTAGVHAFGVTPSTNPSGRCEVVVRQEDAERARSVLQGAT